MKPFLLSILLGMTLTAMGQKNLKEPNRQELNFERLRSLNLSSQQKIRILSLIRREQQLHQQDMEELDKILTGEQKQKLSRWKKSGSQSSDSTSNHKNQDHE